jgi:hypothetical protein
MTDRNGWPRRKSYEAVLTSLVLYAISMDRAAAAEFAYGAGYVGEHSSNITRVSTNEQSEWVHSLIGGIAYRDSNPELATHVLAQAELRAYHNNTFQDGRLYFVDASAHWTISPQRFMWTFEDHHTQAARDITAADTPDNQVGANFFNTGPDVYFRFGAGNTLVLGGRYGNVYFGDSGADNDRIGAYARWQYQMTSMTTASLNYEALNVAYKDNVTNVDFQRTDGFARLEMRPEPSRFMLDYGHTHVERDRGEDLNAALVRLTWIRQISSEASFGIVLSRGYDDVGSALQAGITNPAAPEETPVVAGTVAVATTDLYYSRRAEATYTQLAADWAIQLRVFDREYDYELTDQDFHARGGRVEVTHNPRGVFSTMVYGEAQHAEFSVTAREDENQTVGLRLQYRTSRSLSFGLEASKVRRTSNVVAGDYTDRRLMFGAYYASSPLYAPARR